MLNVAIYLNAEIISYPQWNFILRGASHVHVVSDVKNSRSRKIYNRLLLLFLFNQDKKPDYPTLTEPMWNNVNYLAANFTTFRDILTDLFKKIDVSIEYFKEVNPFAFFFLRKN